MLLTLLPYLTVIANLLLVLAVILGVNQKVRQLRARTGKHEIALQTEIAFLSTEMTDLKGRIQELEQSEPAPENAVPPVAGSGTSVNSTLRSKILKLYRMGQSPERIAGMLRLPKGEVDLLVKVHKMVMRQYEQPVLAPAAGERAHEIVGAKA